MISNKTISKLKTKGYLLVTDREYDSKQGNIKLVDNGNISYWQYTSKIDNTTLKSKWLMNLIDSI